MKSLEEKAYEAFCNAKVHEMDYISAYKTGYKEALPKWHDLATDETDLPEPVDYHDYLGSRLRLAPKFLVKTSTDIKIARYIRFENMFQWKSVNGEIIKVLKWMEIPN